MDFRQTILSPFTGIAFLDPWQTPDSLLSQKGEHLEPPLRDLLRWRGSLTQRLEDSIGQRVELQLINHTHLSSWPNDDRIWPECNISLSADAILIRNAWLVLGGHRVVFAHSQIVLSDLPESDRRTIVAGHQALGYFFMEQNSQLKREHLQLNRMVSQNSPIFSDFAGTQPCWCRRSMFYVNDLLRARILEIFPPVLPCGTKHDESILD
ncbi:MAG: chorismate lyase [Nitrospirae bacterium]|nr:chorismate lyase [Magnetococcales bacterium]